MTISREPRYVFFELSKIAGAAPSSAADYYTYTVTIEAGGRRHTLQITDLVEDPALQRLLAFLEAKGQPVGR